MSAINSPIAEPVPPRQVPPVPAGRSIRWRLLAVMVGATAVALVLSGVSALLLIRRQANVTAIDNASQQTENVADAVQRIAGATDRRQRRPNQNPKLPSGDCGPIPLPCVTLLQLTNISNGAVLAITEDGRLEAAKGQSGDTVQVNYDRLDVDALRRGELQRGVARRRGERVAYAAKGVQVDGEDLVVVATVPLPGELVGARVLVVSGLVGLAVAAALSLWLAGRLSRPLSEMTEAATALAAGDYGRRVSTSAEGEVGTLGTAFNRMAEDLARARASQQQFLMSISHDLRTPLTSIRGYAEAITDGAAAGDDATKAASVIGAEAARLERLVRDLLDLARLDAAEFALHPEQIDLADELGDIGEAFAPRMADAGLTFAVSGPPIPMTTDPERVGQIVGNLLENALRYVPPGRSVTLHWEPQVRSGVDGVAVHVIDGGNGIAAEDLPHVFERLYVAQRYPGERAVGTGLGLSICADLTGKLGGAIDAASESGRGTTFRVWLPSTASA